MSEQQAGLGLVLALFSCSSPRNDGTLKNAITFETPPKAAPRLFLQLIPAAVARGKGLKQESTVCRASPSQQCEEQKMHFGSHCSQAELGAVRERGKQMSQVPSRQREDTGL